MGGRFSRWGCRVLGIQVLLSILLSVAPAFIAAQPTSSIGLSPLIEQRYCGPPKRSVTGAIIRRSDVITAFKRAHPCPVTGLTSGACTGWQIDHIIPLVCGGCDALSNLGWMPVQIKTCTSSWCKDRWERAVYCISGTL